MGKFFNVLIGVLRFLRKHHVNVVVVRNLCPVSLYPVGIKHHNKVAVHHALIVAQNIHEPAPCAVNVYSSDFFQFFPCKNNIIPVH